nr:hypothetical protein [Variovorax sp. E3]
MSVSRVAWGWWVLRVVRLAPHLEGKLGLALDHESEALVERLRRIRPQHAEREVDARVRRFVDHLGQQAGADAPALVAGRQLDLDDDPLVRVARHLEQADRRALVQQQLGAFEAVHQPRHVMGVADFGARGHDVAVHGALPQVEQKGNVLRRGAPARQPGRWREAHACSAAACFVASAMCRA